MEQVGVYSNYWRLDQQKKSGVVKHTEEKGSLVKLEMALTKHTKRDQCSHNRNTEKGDVRYNTYLPIFSTITRGHSDNLWKNQVNTFIMGLLPDGNNRVYFFIKTV